MGVMFAARTSPCYLRSRVSAIIFTNAYVHPITSKPFVGSLRCEDGVVTHLGSEVPREKHDHAIDVNGAWILPGLIDAHVHLGMHPEGEGADENDVNERSGPNQAGIRALDSVNPFDPAFDVALSGGITTVNINPGSSNPIGGQCVAVHCHGSRVDDMVLREPSGMKSALGENPRKGGVANKRTPQTRMGTAYILRDAFTAVQAILKHADAEERLTGDLHNSAIAALLRREYPLRQHCHRSDDIATAMRLAEEFGYDLVLDHGTEATVHAELLASRNIPVLMGPLLGTRKKVELRERSPKHPGVLDRAGVAVSLITDHPVIPVDSLILQAIYAVKEGMDPDSAMRSVTINPARVLGLDDRIGSLEVGKWADIVVWSGNPLDIYQRPVQVYIRGKRVFHYDQERMEGVAAPR